MHRPTNDAGESISNCESPAEVAWSLVLAAAHSTDRLAAADRPAAFTRGDAAQLQTVPEGHPAALLAWRPGAGWESLLPSDDPRHALVDLYLPICSATAGNPITVG